MRLHLCLAHFPSTLALTYLHATLVLSHLHCQVLYKRLMGLHVCLADLSETPFPSPRTQLRLSSVPHPSTSQVLYKRLMGLRVSLADLAELHPEVQASLTHLLGYEGDFEDLALSFQV